MKKIKQGLVAGAVSLSMVCGVALAGCGNVQQAATDAANAAANAVQQFIEGDVTGEVGKEYSTRWFTFTVETMKTETSYGDYTASDGKTLLVAHITETNTSGQSQPFGTFDWYVDGTGVTEVIYPIDPFNDKMMPASFTLKDKESASYDVVIEYPKSISAPKLVYVEIDEKEAVHTTFSIPIK